MLAAVLLLILFLALFGGLGFVAHFLWWVLIAIVILWVLGWFVGGGGVAPGARRRWYGRW